MSPKLSFFFFVPKHVDCNELEAEKNAIESIKCLNFSFFLISTRHFEDDRFSGVRSELVVTGGHFFSNNTKIITAFAALICAVPVFKNNATKKFG